MIEIVSSENERDRFRLIIREVLELLNSKLGTFEQTTHGSMNVGTLDDVLDGIYLSYNPNNSQRRRFTYDVSELHQRISSFLRSKS